MLCCSETFCIKIQKNKILDLNEYPYISPLVKSNIEIEALVRQCLNSLITVFLLLT